MKDVWIWVSHIQVYKNIIFNYFFVAHVKKFSLWFCLLVGYIIDKVHNLFQFCKTCAYDFKKLTTSIPKYNMFWRAKLSFWNILYIGAEVITYRDHKELFALNCIKICMSSWVHEPWMDVPISCSSIEKVGMSLEGSQVRARTVV
jgi:hypothetical protein